MHEGTSDPSASPSASRARLTGGLVICVLFMGSTLLTPLYDLYRSAFGLSALGMVLLYAVYVVGNLGALLFLGRLSDLVGRKPVVLASLALAAVSALLFLAGKGVASLFAGRIVNGCAVGLGAGAATAWIAEFTPPDRRARAASVMTSFNFVGLAFGPVLAGVLVQYAPMPLGLPFVAYLALLALTAAPVLATAETVAAGGLAWNSFKPRLGLPSGMRLAFVPPAVAGFSAMAVVGLYAALGPTLIQQTLHIDNRALGGVMVTEAFVVAAVAILATRHLGARPGTMAGLALTPPGLVLLVQAQRTGSVPLMLLGTAVCGAAAALSYRSGLAAANALAPADRRAEVVSAYFVCCFLGNALPVIGVGMLSRHIGLGRADMVFAALISLLALGALAGIRRRTAEPGRSDEALGAPRP